LIFFKIFRGNIIFDKEVDDWFNFEKPNNNICIEKIYLTKKYILIHQNYNITFSLKTPTESKTETINTSSLFRKWDNNFYYLKGRFMRKPLICFKNLPGPGNYEITVTLDSNNDIDEVDETNNTHTERFFLKSTTH